MNGTSAALGEGTRCRSTNRRRSLPAGDPAPGLRPGGIGLQCDVGDAAMAEHALAEARQAHGPAAILVNCAGIAAAKRIVGRDGPLQLSEFELVIRVNLIGTFNLMRLAA